jgi:hypothetical protein
MGHRKPSFAFVRLKGLVAPGVSLKCKSRRRSDNCIQIGLKNNSDSNFVYLIIFANERNNRLSLLGMWAPNQTESLKHHVR